MIRGTSTENITVGPAPVSLERPPTDPWCIPLPAVQSPAAPLANPQKVGAHRAKDSRCHDDCGAQHFARNLNTVSYTSLVALHTQFGQGNLDNREWRICTLPTPRNLKMQWRIWAKFVVLLVFAGIWSSEFGEYIEVSYRVLRSMAATLFIASLFALLLLLIFYALFRGNISDYSLLKRGKCIVGKVISQRKIRGRRGSRSEICYSFPVGPGKPMTGRGIDLTDCYMKDTPVLVFFDPVDISKHVAYCCTDWIVRLEDGTLLEP